MTIEREDFEKAFPILIFVVGGYVAALMALIATRQLWLMWPLFGVLFLPLFFTAARAGRIKPRERPGRFAGGRINRLLFLFLGVGCALAGTYLSVAGKAFWKISLASFCYSLVPRLLSWLGGVADGESDCSALRETWSDLITLAELDLITNPVALSRVLGSEPGRHPARVTQL